MDPPPPTRISTYSNELEQPNTHRASSIEFNFEFHLLADYWSLYHKLTLGAESMWIGKTFAQSNYDQRFFLESDQ